MISHPSRRRRGAALALAALLGAAAGCARGAATPAPVDTRHDACARCRMAVSDARFAAQIAAPREEPSFFDDIGCLRAYLAEGPRLPPGAVAFVADHRTGAWIRAARAVYTRKDDLDTPMSSHLVAHVDAASRDADPAASGGVPVEPASLFAQHPIPDGAP